MLKFSFNFFCSVGIKKKEKVENLLTCHKSAHKSSYIFLDIFKESIGAIVQKRV